MKFYSKIYKKDINDICDFRKFLLSSLRIYYDRYVNYIKTSELDNFYDSLDIPFVILDNVLSELRDSLGLDSYFSLFFDFIDEQSVFTQRSINSYIGSRCNKYLSVNVLCNKHNKRECVTLNGVLIEYIHDYTVVDITRDRDKIKSRHIY